MYKATYTPKPVEIVLSAREANVIAIQRICDVYGWNLDWKIEHPYVIRTVDAHTTHSFQYEEKVRLLTDQDIIANSIIEKLKASI